MSSPEYSNLVIPNLPSPITGDGLFTVSQVVPNTISLFTTVSTNPSTSYSYPLIYPANLIGTSSQPFIPAAISAYITTLYDNVYNINNNLRNDISTSAVNDRTYPTSYAVQQYVQSQVAGTQVINNSDNDTYIVNTTVNNTLIEAVPNAAKSFFYVNGSSTAYIALLWMNTNTDTPRSGATKTVMFSASNYLTTPGNIVFLYAGDTSYFINLGQQYKYYMFVYRGDYVEFIQGSTGTNTWDWLVTNYKGVFTNSVQVCDINGAPVSITQVSGNTSPEPAFGLSGISRNLNTTI